MHFGTSELKGVQSSMRKIFFLVLSFFSFQVSAKTIIQKEVSLSPVELKELESKIDGAESRPFKEYPTVYTFQWSDDLNVWCPANMPVNGIGCSLNIKVDTSISMIKGLSVIGKSAEVEQKLAGLDPNDTEEHLNFGSLFVPSDSYGSHYFCQPSGESPNKKWECFLYLHEEVN